MIFMKDAVFIMKTIAIIESCDTKYTETAYMKECIEKAGLKALVLNTATGPLECANPDDNGKVVDVSRGEIVAAYGTPWEELEDKTKGEKIEFMRKAVTAYVEKLYKDGKIHGIISVGGLQNGHGHCRHVRSAHWLPKGHGHHRGQRH